MPLFGLFIDPMYLIIMIPGFLLAAWSSFKVKSAFSTYRQIRSSQGLTGAEVARKILQRNGIFDVQIEETAGQLSDHYDPATKTVRLSSSVYHEPSIASVAIASHEVGHALQHAKGYAPLSLRTAAVPVARFGSYAPWIILAGGFILHSTSAIYLGVILFLGTVIFQLITLPVEFNASSRAKEQLVAMNLVNRQDAEGITSVLSAAAMTYVAAAVSAIMTLIYYLIRLGLLGGNDD
ncbi:MAG: zinc metallopeptidase [Deltaproteobacteria bacterium]|nr:zinc metallopeptidase [Deltaproteobacteria bacterium]